MSSLDLGVIGNGSFGALIDEEGRIVWCCLPRFDGDPVFHDLLNGKQEGDNEGDRGFWEISLVGQKSVTREYRTNTAILVTTISDDHGNAIEITDFAPRFATRGRMFQPMSLVRRVRPVSGTPRIKVRLRPGFNYGKIAPTVTRGSNHARFMHSGLVLRLTTNAPITYVLDETSFQLKTPVSFILGPDETLSDGIEETARKFEEDTETYWRQWVRRLALPLEWQQAVIRAAITLKLCCYEETGAIVAAMTTSIPEAADSGRNWDYRFCWLRDAFFVIRALNSLAEVETMENYLRYLGNVVGGAEDGHLQPVFGIGLETDLTEHIVDTLPGYRGMGPVRRGNQAYEHLQHDVYGNVVLAAAQSFFDDRLLRPGSLAEFEAYEKVGERAYAMHNVPDAGMWELRTRARTHTSSSLMCWAACDRLARIAAHMGLEDRATHWRGLADEIHRTICTRAWSEEKGAFVESFEGEALDAGLLLMAEVNFISPDDKRFVGTLEAIEKSLRRGNHMFRYASADDFGMPQNAFNICTFWYIDALARVGRTDEAREIFESILSCRNSLGLLSEDTDPATGELWGNYPQTYSLVGIINAAMRLSRKWEEEV
ncbi:GH15 family glucan-1,4-alpha-glucosidase [Parvibaculum indicum]|uniref:glycoside hydrolase family 15 protein n=1 Tax=Parvibaculum indicum TaxID=562969 RepID=UPI00142044B9|nr:glycoside hydrolase family 15 protein [Parvibaculum indicum]NIJ40842.1 GH15 family glucan-1,4-alpha-glucosidase [Parvibaculum indicum]